MIASSPSHGALEVRLERRLVAVHGRDRLTSELHRLAVDVVGRAEHDELDAVAKATLHDAMAIAVHRTEVDVAERFVHELAIALAEAPDDLFARLARAETRRDMGLD
jgi:hypothetical protein